MLKSFLKEKNILQVCLSNKLKNSNIEFKDFLGYQGKKTSTLFYGIYEKADLHRIFCHKSVKVIYWDSGALNIDIDQIKSFLNDKNFNNKLIAHICDSKKICSFLDSLSVEYTYIQEYVNNIEDNTTTLYQQFMEKYDVYSKENALNLEDYRGHIDLQEIEFNKRTEELSKLNDDNSESKIIEGEKINASKNMIFSNITLQEMELEKNKNINEQMKEEYIILN